MKKILIANRGEIALRIMRTCREMDIRTAAIYSEADRNAPHVRYADEAVCVGPPPSAQSYLRGDLIIAAAKKLKADGIHPGYGFLSENEDFARKVEEAGLTFIGPPPEAIRIMGSKLAAKDAVKKYKIPMIPGSPGAVRDAEAARPIAKKIGYPVLIKASAGGGGKGMRVVHREAELEEQMTLAVGEATSAFGDGSVFIEKYVTSPRHVEVQVLADRHGNIVHLFERECSIQRRHQKVIEEAPSVAVSPAMRKAMGGTAVKVARSCGYVGAGTVEFILDENGRFYFLEMNTRLQVEHPVTELITGIDLVREQIHAARGEKLKLKQNDLAINGHAMEVRVYAEDPVNNFLPDTGVLKTYRRPAGPGVRVDDGYEEGMEVPIYYDPMLSKLIVHGRDRREAIARMLRAISDYRVTGVTTTLGFCRFVLGHKAFVSGKFDTHFVEKHFRPDMLSAGNAEEAEIAALAVAVVLEHSRGAPAPANGSPVSPWRTNRLSDP